MCIQQHQTLPTQQKNIHYEMIDGKSGSLQVSNTSTEDQDKLLLKKHLQETHGFQKDNMQIEYDEQTQSYIVLYESVFSRFLRSCSCSIPEAKTDEDKQKVQRKLQAFVNEHKIKELNIKISKV